MARTGRPRGFDEAAVVTGAQERFWQRGYDSTSLRDLAGELDVLPGSLHRAFGSKHSLFLRALSAYMDSARLAAAEVAAGESPLRAIGGLLEAVLASAADAPGRGCMLGNSAMELLPDDEEAGSIVQAGLRALEQGIEAGLREAQRLGEVRADLDCPAHARLLVALIQGLHVTARAEADPHRLDDVIGVAIESMMPGPQHGATS